MTEPNDDAWVRFQADELSPLVAEVFAAAGMSAQDAGTLADALVWAETRGQTGHGVLRIPSYLGQIERGVLDATATPAVDELIGGLYRVDAARAAGPVAMSLALAKGVDLARRFGVSFGVVCESHHTGAVGRYAEMAANEGLIAITAGAAGPIMAIHGAKTRSIGTNPIAIGVPGAGGSPALVLDMATSVVAFGQILTARRLGQSIPADWALDANGAPTEDPAAAAVLLPFAGAKGSGLAVAFEMIAGLLAGRSNLLASLLGQAEGQGLQNSFLLLIDVAAFRDRAAFEADAAQLTGLLRGLPKAPGVSEILLPGDRGARRRDQSLSEGVSIPRDTWRDIRKAAAAVGSDLPAQGHHSHR